MFLRRIGCAALAMLWVATVAQGGAVIELVPDDPGASYEPGSTVGIGVYLSSDADHAIELRGYQLDFRATDAALVLTGPDNWPSGPPGDGIAEFVFYMGDVADLGAVYFQSPNYPVPVAVFTELGPLPGSMKILPAAGGGSMFLGSLAVILPTEPGSYVLDPFNAGDGDLDAGAWVAFGFGLDPDDPITRWRAQTGDLAGEFGLFQSNDAGGFDFTLVPEPATLVLLGIGAVAVRRRRAQKLA